MKICVIGLGYIGLPTAAIMAVNGHDVLGVDVNRRIVDMINKGQVHIEERGLKTIFNASIQSGRLKAALKPAPADAFVIAVPTPERDHVADLSYLDSAVASVVPHLRKGSLVIVESTIPPHTVERNVIPVLKKTGLEPGKDLHVAHCPERVIPGQTVRELVENDRVLGGLTPECAQKAEAIYKTFVQGRIECCDLCTAETVKLVENSYRDVNIAFANMVSNLCLDFGISSARVIELANMHPRVNILQPGPGVGGHCLPVDPWFLVQENKAKTGLLRVARQINDERPGMIVGKLKKMVGRVKEPKIAVLGVSYKGDVDDVRESPAVEA
ncbi:nucleotide sugar dehydrogenase, partial [bacterium]|nr:nucleotide sugar dehydrogenase [bacterium]